MSPLFYTEIRIIHKSKEDKKEYELKLVKALVKANYSNRTEFVKEKLRDLMKEVE